MFVLRSTSLPPCLFTVMLTDLVLVQVDPDNYLGYSPHSSLDPGGDITSGPAMLQDTWRQPDLSPRIHPKSMENLLDLHQAEILEDLNSLGRYSRSVVIVSSTRQCHHNSVQCAVLCQGRYLNIFIVSTICVFQEKRDKSCLVRVCCPELSCVRPDSW